MITVEQIKSIKQADKIYLSTKEGVEIFVFISFEPALSKSKYKKKAIFQNIKSRSLVTLQLHFLQASDVWYIDYELAADKSVELIKGQIDFYKKILMFYKSISNKTYPAEFLY